MRKFSTIYAGKYKHISKVKSNIKLSTYRSHANWQGKDQPPNRKMSKWHGQFTENKMQMTLK